MPSRASRVRRHDDDLGILGLPGDVSPWDVRFDADDPADLEALGDGRFRVRLHAEPGLHEGRAVLRNTEEVISVPLDPIEAGRFVQWSAVVGPFESPAGLSFAFSAAASGNPVYVVPSGVSSSVERLDRWIINPEQPPLDVPDWARGAVIYQIFPDRFANGDPGNDPDDTVAWGSEPHARQFQGGDLAGVTERLGHLRELGVDAIYLNPIFASPSNHRYDTVDYLSVDPVLGGNDAFKRLVDRAHAAGIRIILDASFNHTHPRFFAFADLIARGEDSPYRDWFVVKDWPVRLRVRTASRRGRLAEWISVWASQTGIPIEEVEGDGPAVEPTYEAWYGVPTMPRLDLSHPAARGYVLDVAKHWLVNYDIDGWRMDVARYIDPDFWPDFRTACRDAKPDAYLLAEIMGDVSHWLRGDGFDATMNYTFRSIALGFFGHGEMNGVEMLDHCTRLYGRHALATTLVNHNLLGSHDTPRFLTEARGELWRAGLATVFQLTFPGAPGIYYGDELGMTGGDDPGCRGAMPWDEVGREPQLMATIAEITALRRRYSALRSGSFRPLAATSDLVAFQRSAGRSRFVVAFNRGSTPGSVDLAGDGLTLWGSGELAGDRLHVAARSAVIVRA